MIILTDSMVPEFESGDLIICHTVEPEDVQAGDIICFYDPAGNGMATVTHRVQEVITDIVVYQAESISGTCGGCSI